MKGSTKNVNVKFHLTVSLQSCIITGPWKVDGLQYHQSDFTIVTFYHSLTPLYRTTGSNVPWVLADVMTNYSCVWFHHSAWRDLNQLNFEVIQYRPTNMVIENIILVTRATLSQSINRSIWNSNLNMYSTLNSNLSLVFNLEFQS